MVFSEREAMEPSNDDLTVDDRVKTLLDMLMSDGTIDEFSRRCLTDADVKVNRAWLFGDYFERRRFVSRSCTIRRLQLRPSPPVVVG